MFYDKFIYLCNRDGKKPTPTAQKLGCFSSNIAQWKKGSTPRMEVLQKFAEEFNVPISYFFEDEKNPTVKDDGISEMEHQVINAFRQLSPERQKALLLLLGIE